MGVLGGWAFSHERGTPVTVCEEDPISTEAELGSKNKILCTLQGFLGIKVSLSASVGVRALKH